MRAMSMRSSCWSSKINLPPKKLPPITPQFACSSRWMIQLDTLTLDISRTKNINPANAIRTMLRYACNMPTFGYSQGNLYVLRPVLYVYSDEAEVFWAFARIMDIINIFGPMNRDVGFRRSGIPTWVTDEFTKLCPTMDMEWLQIAIQLRWLYVMWGQTCSSVEIQCALMDYAIGGRVKMYQLAAAMIRRFYPRIEHHDDTMLKFKCIFEIQIDTLEEVAFIIASAATQFPDDINTANDRRSRRIWSR